MVSADAGDPSTCLGSRLLGLRYRVGMRDLIDLCSMGLPDELSPFKSEVELRRQEAFTATAAEEAEALSRMSSIWS